eukprot:872298_1
MNKNNNEMKQDIDENKDNNNNDDDEEEDGATAAEIEELRNELDKKLSNWNCESKGDEIWRQLCLVTNLLSQQLCEELRTILEPLETTKLGGDFRVGKRINMKKVIPYIASQFRKD